MADKRLIDANARIEEIKKAYCTDCDNYGGVRCRACWVDDAIGMIDDAHTVDAVEVVHGHWDDSGRYQFPSGKTAIRCSICGCALSEGEYHLFNWNYCPVCGAKMDGGADHV